MNEYWNSSNYSWQHDNTGPVMAGYLWSCLLMSSAQLAQTTWGWSLCHQRHEYWDICKYILNSNKENVKQKTAWSLFLAQWTLFWLRSGLIWRGLWLNVKFLCVKLCVCCWIKVIIGQLITARPSHQPRVITHHFSQFRDVLCHKLASWHLECAMSGAEC